MSRGRPRSSRIVRVKPRNYRPTKADLEKDMSIDASPEDVFNASVESVEIVEDEDAEK